MSIQLKLRRGTTAQHSTFTGASGEVTVDTDKKTLVVHDGTTAGGVALATDSSVVHKTGNETIAGTKTFSSDVVANGLTVGKGAGAVSTNTAVGASALAANTTGAHNAAFGYQAGYTNTSGSQLTAFGDSAGKAYAAATNPWGSTFIGFSAGASTSTGVDNTVVGGFALVSNTSGSSNVSVGAAALYSNTTASSNTVVGYQAGYSNATGGANVFVGYQAGYSDTASGLNVYAGYQAGYLATGNWNTFIGPASGESVTTGTKNTIIGRYSGNQGGLDIRTANNYIVLSDGDGNPREYFDGSGNRNTYCQGTTPGVKPAYDCRAWVNFNGTGTVAIRASGNVSSITDNGGSGDYTVNFSTAMSDANYSVNGTADRSGSVQCLSLSVQNSTAPTTTSVRIRTDQNGTGLDGTYVCVSIFR